MAKFFGQIGYAIPTKIRPGVFEDQIEERDYFGDVIRINSRWSASPDSTNDDLTLNNQFSIVADPFAQCNFHSMKYVKYLDSYWKVTSVEPQFPRILITVGGVYNGPRGS